MKRAVILHGTDGKPTDQWFPWLRDLLQKSGYAVFAPVLPQNHTPTRTIYDKFLRESDWDFHNNVLIGHSSGATTILNLLSINWFPHVRAAILVGAFLNEKWTKQAPWYEPGQFDNLFLDTYDSKKIRSKADAFYFVHGDNDPYCDIEDAQTLCAQLKGEFITIKNGHHLGSSSGFKELPAIEQALREDNLI